MMLIQVWIIYDKHQYKLNLVFINDLKDFLKAEIEPL